MQEDQLYAMEDYLSQYQQLVCKYRSENASLRRQLSEIHPDDADLPSPQGPARGRGPSLRSPEAQPNGDPAPSPGPIEAAPPDVPPLETATKNKEPTTIAASYESNGEHAGEAAGEAASAAGKRTPKIIDIDPRATAKPSNPTIDLSRNAPKPPPRSVAIRGEVIANIDGGGPRLAVQVKPLDASNRCTELDGTASLMLLAPNEKENRRNLARWDYGPQELEAAVERTMGEPVLSFYLELPPDTPINQATEIWVRLVPRNGAKLLAHAGVQLSRPGTFSSVEHTRPLGGEDDSPTLPETEADSTAISRVKSNLIQSDWTTARPDKPARSSDADFVADNQWRASSEVIPVAVHAAQPSPRAVDQAAHRASDRRTVTPAYTRPTWTPDRSRVVRSDLEHSNSRSASLARPPSSSATR
jgi:hypothetical protein